MNAETVGMSLFRVLPNGTGRCYSAVRFRRGGAGVARTLRQFEAVGWIGEGSYGVLDLLADNGDIVDDRLVPSAHAFQRIKKRLGLTVERGER